MSNNAGQSEPSEKKVEKPLDKRNRMCYNEYTRQGETQTEGQEKKEKKVLDKRNQMCYNKNVKRNTSYR